MDPLIAQHPFRHNMAAKTPPHAGLYICFQCSMLFCSLTSFARRGSTVDAVIGVQFPCAQEDCEWGAIMNPDR